MEAFVWNERFVTGLDTVDAQHHHLVDIINLVGDMLVTHYAVADDLETIFKQLADYARYHFAEEERLMEEIGLDPRHSSLHKKHHTEFVEQVVNMWRARGSMNDPAAILHGFLVTWLSYHILGEDQAMARQIKAIRAGMPPAQAYQADQRNDENNVAALLSALQKLYHLMALQNRELADANLGLEKRIAARTQELTAANERLAAEQEKLADVLKSLGKA